MAGPTRLELATSGVTGRRSNQLNYGPDKKVKSKKVKGKNSGIFTFNFCLFTFCWWAVQDLNL